MVEIFGYYSCVVLVFLTYGWIISEILKMDCLKDSIDEVKGMVELIKEYHEARNQYWDYEPSIEEFLKERSV